MNVDEYVGFSADHPRSYAHYMHEHFYRHVNVDPHRRHAPQGFAPDLWQEAERYENPIESLGGLDLLLPGLGGNGHIAFNEPESSAGSRTRVVRLAQATLEANRRYFGSPDEQPRSALTIGIGTILKARKTVVVATGETKAAAVKDIPTGAPIANCPAAALAAHQRVQLLLDAAEWREIPESWHTRLGLRDDAISIAYAR